MIAFCLIFLVGNFASIAFASDQRKLTYAGRILKSDGTPLNASTQFKLQVTDTLGTCVMWEENITSTVTNGVFDLQLGSGTLVFDGGGSAIIDKVFAQGKAIGCKASTPSVNLIPATSDDRNLAVSFNDGTGWQTLSSQIPIKAVPFAMSASGIAGFPVDLTGLADTYVLKYDLATKTWIPTANGAGAGVSSVTAGAGITLGGTAANPVVNLTTPVSAANGGTGLNTSTASNGQVLIGTGAGLALNTLTAGSGITITNASGAITIAATGSGTVTSVTSAGAPIVIGGTASAPTVGINQANTTTAGYLSSTDWNTFNGKLSGVSNSAALANGKVWIGDGAGKAQEITLSQDVTTTNLGVTTVNKIQNVLVNSAAVAGGVFMYDTATSTWKGKAFPACTATQAPYWNSGTDTIQCQTVSPAFASVTSKPTTISGYGITDAVQNAGVGAGNVITSVQSGNTAGRPAFGTDGRIYIDTQAAAIYRDNGTAWVQVSGSGGGGTVTAVTASAPLASSGGTAPNITLTGLVPLANGGTNANLTASNGGVVWSNASQLQILAGTATAGLPLISGSTATPSWSTINLSSGNIQMPAGGNISNASGAMTVSASTNLTVQSNTGSVTTIGNPNTTSSTVINGGGVGGGLTLTPGSLGLGVTGWTSGFVKSNGSGVLAPAALTSGDVTTALTYTPVNKAGDTMTGPLVNNTSSASTALAVTQSGAGYAATLMGGNVGIGTTTPAQKLSVAGTIESTSGGIKFPDGTTQTTASTAAGSAGSAVAWVNFNSAGTILSSFNVTSVTKSSTGRYVVNFSSTLSDTNYAVTTGGVNTGSGDGGWASVDQAAGSAKASTYVKIVTYNSTGSFQDWPEVYVAVYQGSGTAALANGQWTQAGSDVYRSSGNVGIGMSSPVLPLEVVGNSSYAARFSGSSADSSVLGFVNTSSGGRSYALGSTGSVSGAGNGFSIYDVTSSASRFLITPTGNVGLGTTNPTLGDSNLVTNNWGVLTVASTPTTPGGASAITLANQKAVPAAGDRVGAVHFVNTNNGSQLYSGFINVSLTGSGGANGFGGEMGLFTKADNSTSVLQRMVLTNNGNVGIGTASPSVKLDVDGSIRPGSTGVTTGGACVGEGAFAYDLTAHAPVYCSNAGVWTAMGGSPSGTVGGGCIYGSGWGVATNCALSAGMSCSAGYTARVSTYCNGGGCAYNSSGTYAMGICVKN